MLLLFVREFVNLVIKFFIVYERFVLINPTPPPHPTKKKKKIHWMHQRFLHRNLKNAQDSLQPQ